jgi:hypothetical protein
MPAHESRIPTTALLKLEWSEDDESGREVREWTLPSKYTLEESLSSGA